MEFNFTNPWLLFLIIPGIIISLYLFLRVDKRFRYSRNRVVSLILFLISNLLIVFMISGFNIKLDMKNNDNEVILLVDKSLSTNEDYKAKDEFVREAIDNKPDIVSLGVITYGYDAVYAVPLNKKAADSYKLYEESKRPNPYGTNLEAALSLAFDKLNNKSTSRLIILSDLAITDGNALGLIKALALEGVDIRVKRLKSNEIKNEVLISDFIKPTSAIRANKPSSYEVIIESSIKSDISLRVYDNNKSIKAINTSIAPGKNKIELQLSLDMGLHEIRIEMDARNDLSIENNTFIGFVAIDEVDGVLIINNDNSSLKIKDLIDYKNGGISKDITIKRVSEIEPSINYLRGFNEVILNNISNANLPVGFDTVLHDYTYNYGGSVLSVGGNKESNGEITNNTYNKADMEGSLYEEMLPVISEEYTPPVGVMVVIDVSGSMTNDIQGGGKRIDAARASAKEALNALDPRDYFGVIAFHERPQLILKPTPVSQKTYIEGKINTISAEMKGTVYSSALDMAGVELRSLERVNKKHIILISDGVPSADDNKYLNKTEENLSAGVTTSCISFMGNIQVMDHIAKAGNGRYLKANSASELKDKLKEELRSEEIREFEYKSFTPRPGELTSIYDGVDINNLPVLDGFYGVRLKSEAKSVMVGDYNQPIYAVWDYGNGTVGSLMVDLDGYFSSNLINSSDGKRLINNIVGGLMPPKSIKNKEIDLALEPESIRINANLHTSLNPGEDLYLTLSLIEDGVDNKRVIKEIKAEGFSGNDSFIFEADVPGIYELRADKRRGNSIIASEVSYFSYSYSRELNPFIDIAEVDELNRKINEISGNLNLNDNEAYVNLKLYYHKDIDLRYAFSIIVLINLLIDIWLMKFQIKWPHEIIRDRRKRNEGH